MADRYLGLVVDVFILLALAVRGSELQVQPVSF